MTRARRRIRRPRAVHLVAFVLLGGGLAGGGPQLPASAASGASQLASTVRPAAAPASVPATGYWLVASDGGIFSFGDARFFGSTGNIRLNRPIVAMAAFPTGQGYWLAASDGGVFAFGDARFLGSTGNIRLNRPIVAMGATPTGRGYWLAASDGGVFSFGDATFWGSGGSAASSNPAVVAMTPTTTGRGYWLATREGRTHPFGDATPVGSVDRLTQPIVSFARTSTGTGGWLVAADGGVFALGDARFLGSTGGMHLNQPIVAGTAVAGERPAAGSDGPAPPSAPPAPPVSPGAPPAGPAPAGSFKIGLIGDTGYSKAQDSNLIAMRSRMAQEPLAFVVHDGDIQAQNTPCTDDRLYYVLRVFDGFAAPLVYTPGDNEWKSCPNPQPRLEAIRRIFFSTNETLGRTWMTVERQSPEYVENARWTMGGVTFATLDVPGPSGGGVSTDIERDWLNGTFDAAEAVHSAGVMIIWQDDPFNGNANDELVEDLKERTEAFGRPVVLVHGDTHRYQLDHPWNDVANFTRLETFWGGAKKWVEATVDPASHDVFSFDTVKG
jgi:hypothetical protein